MHALRIIRGIGSLLPARARSAFSDNPRNSRLEFPDSSGELECRPIGGRHDVREARRGEFGRRIHWGPGSYASLCTTEALNHRTSRALGPQGRKQGKLEGE